MYVKSGKNKGRPTYGGTKAVMTKPSKIRSKSARKASFKKGS